MFDEELKQHAKNIIIPKMDALKREIRSYAEPAFEKFYRELTGYRSDAWDFVDLLQSRQQDSDPLFDHLVKRVTENLVDKLFESIKLEAK